MDEAHFETQLAALAAAIGERTRVRILCALMDGRAYTATELSTVADVTASTASSHLARLQQQRLIDCVPQGRHRYFRLASVQVAEALEKLMGLAGSEPITPRSKTPQRLRFARTCYDHMAGELAVALHDRLCRQGWLDAQHYTLSAAGLQALQGIGLSLEAIPAQRKFACACLDWSERRPHLGGHLGAVLLQAFEKQRWVVRQLDSRALQLTASGKRALQAHFDLLLP
ncbi:transcriptional regulator, ArsR family [Aquitalea magnusonii]|uniref:Transcriptional regulator, ArsR family n=1 Tax=Aquitalea magnusonii TaxID=332411 RepID=A0A3G9GH42_9NEIS|nr:helix-turn-helix transcriptional regulator [Aquitalea magnusonii]BBF84967.1 transcriptional regulator, ArsR family [Aquitalea magnusonii]